MRQLIFGLTLLFSTHLWSQSDWRAIVPLDYCQDFTIEYQVTSDGEYKVRIPSPSGPKELEQKLENINDLSSLTDILVEESLNHCSDGKTVLEVRNDAIVFEEKNDLENRICQTPLVYSEPYLDLTRDIVKILQHNGNRCDQLMAYTELQTKISQLSDEDLIKLKRPSNLGHLFIKLFMGKETDKLVDLYTSCGGKNFTDKFVSNLIMIEVKNACVMPKPPGMFSFEEAKAIAEDVAKDYNGLGLMDINKKKGEITKKALLALTGKGLKAEVEKLLGPHIEDMDAFVGSLDAYKNLQNEDFDDLDPDYVGLGFTLEATLEVAKKAVPILANASFKGNLPGSWSEEKKTRYMNEEFLPLIENSYASCMQEHYEKTGYESGLSMKKKLKLRGELKENYCQAHPDQCAGASCEESINVLSQDPKIADSQVVQGCVMKSMLDAVKPTIKQGILAQVPSFEKDFTLTDEDIEGLTQQTFKTLLACSNRQIMKKTGGDDYAISDPLNPPIVSNPKYLQQVSAGDFEKILMDCANVAEIGVAKEFFAKTLLSMKPLAELYSDSVAVETNGSAQPTELHFAVDEILGKTYDQCVLKQHFMKSVKEGQSKTRNPMLCVPLVEIEAAKKIINSTLGKLYKDSGMEGNPEGVLSMKQFENCADKALENAMGSLGADDDEVATPIRTDQEAANYLVNNNEFYGCVKSAIVDTTSIVGGKMYDDTTADMAKQLSDPSYLQTLKAGALNETKQCFKKKLDEIANWKEFMAFNDQDGLTKLQDDCAARAVDYVLPKTLIKETAGQMAPLRQENFLNGATEVGNVLAEAALQLRRRYNLEVPRGLKGDEIVEWSFAQAHNAHLKTKGNDTNSFVAEYTGIVMKDAFGTVHHNVAKKIGSLSKNNHSQFFEALSPQCLKRVYDQYNTHITKLIEGLAAAPKSSDNKGPMLDEIAKMLLSGLDYQKGLGSAKYNQKMREVKNVCANLSKYPEPEDLAKAGTFDFLLKGVVQSTLYDSFKDVAVDQCKADLKGVLNTRDLNRACQTFDHRSPQFFNTLILQTPQGSEKRRTLLFAKERHLEMIKLLDAKLNNSAELDRTVFSGTPPVLDYIYENFSDVAAGKKSTMDRLSDKITAKLFSDKSRNSFADKFVEIQVTNGLGLAGYDQAYAAINRQTIDDSVGWWTDLVVNKNKVMTVSREALVKKWTPEGIQEMISWDKMHTSARERLIQSVYTNAVKPAVTGREADNDQIAQDIGNHAANYKYPNDKKTFEQRMTEYINDYVMSNKSRVLGIE